MIRKFKKNLALMKEEVSIPEYILWWAIRLCMVFHIVRELRPGRDTIDYILPFFITFGTFAVFFIRMLLPEKSFFGRLSFKAQKYISFMIFFGTFIGNYFSLYSVNGPMHYDWILHGISGAIITMLGYHLLVAVNGDKTKLTPQISALGSIGFSCILMVVWEMIEFVGDFLWGDDNQKYDWVLQTNDPFYPILSNGKPGPDQYGVFDTVIDMLLALLVTVGTAVILFVVLTLREKSEKKAQEVDLISAAKEEAVAV